MDIVNVICDCDDNDYGDVLMILFNKIVVDYFECCDLLYILHQRWVCSVCISSLGDLGLFKACEHWYVPF